MYAPTIPNQFFASLPKESIDNPELIKLWSSKPVNKYETNDNNIIMDATKLKPPEASFILLINEGFLLSSSP